MILNHLPISGYSGVLKFDMELFVNVAIKVRNRPVVYSRCEAGASVYFGHISSSICSSILFSWWLSWLCG